MFKGNFNRGVEKKNLNGLTNISFLLILLVVFSCKKPEESEYWTEVNIRANNYITGAPITDVACGVLYFKDGFLLNDENVILDQGATENGEYSFGFKAKKNKIYWAEASLDIDKYFTIDFSSYLNLNYGQTNNFNFELVPYGNLSTKTTNTSCFDEFDEIIIYRPNIDVPQYNGYSPTPKYGCYNNTTSFTKIPSGRYAYEWHVTKNSVTTIYYDTLNLLPGQTVVYEINY